MTAARWAQVSPTAVLAAALVGVAVALLLPGRRRPVALDAGPEHSTGRSLTLVVLGVLALASLGWSVLSGTTFTLAVIVTLASLAVLGMFRRRAAAVAADRRSEQVLAACESLASDLAAGQPPLVALDRAAGEWPELAPAAAAGRMGADVPAALRVLADRPGGRQLRTLAASWAVAHHTGAGLAHSIRRAADSIRADRRTSRLVASELSAARATARMLAVLPMGVLVLGSGIGGDPVGFLVGSPFGLGCLAAGVALSVAGMRWLELIADRVLRR